MYGIKGEGFLWFFWNEQKLGSPDKVYARLHPLN